MGVKEVEAIGGNLEERGGGRAKHRGRRVPEELLEELEHLRRCLWCCSFGPVCLAVDGLIGGAGQEVRQRVGHRLPNVGRRVGRTLLNRHEQEWPNEWHAYRRHNPQRERSYECIRIREVALERVDGEEREVGLVTRVAHQVHVHQLLDLHVINRHILDNVCKKVRDGLVERCHPEERLHAMELFLCEFTVESATHVLCGAALEVSQVGAEDERIRHRVTAPHRLAAGKWVIPFSAAWCAHTRLCDCVFNMCAVNAAARGERATAAAACSLSRTCSWLVCWCSTARPYSTRSASS